MRNSGICERNEPFACHLAHQTDSLSCPQDPDRTARTRPPAGAYPAYWVKYESVDGLTFTGTEKPYQTCGDYLRVEKCPDYGQETINGAEHTLRTVKNHCGRAVCAVCSYEWSNEEATRSADRLRGGSDAFFKRGVKLGLPRHWSISPPQDWAIELVRKKGVIGVNQIRKMAVDLAKRAGVLGGVAVVHPWRQDKHKENTWVISPHVHIVGYGVMTQSVNFFKMSGGWIYKYKGTRKSNFKTVRYLLSHAGIVEGRHTLTYFGCFAYNNLKTVVVKITKERPRCLACGKELIGYELDRNGEIDCDKPFKLPKTKVEIVDYVIPERTLSKMEGKWIL